MKELAVPDKTKTMASKAAVDLHDHLKRDMMTLFSLEKVLAKKVRCTCKGNSGFRFQGIARFLGHGKGFRVWYLLFRDELF